MILLLGPALWTSKHWVFGWAIKREIIANNQNKEKVFKREKVKEGPYRFALSANILLTLLKVQKTTKYYENGTEKPSTLTTGTEPLQAIKWADMVAE